MWCQHPNAPCTGVDQSIIVQKTPRLKQLCLKAKSFKLSVYWQSCIFRFNPFITVSPPLCVSISLLFFTALQQGGGTVSLPPSPPPKLLFPASVLLCRAGTRRNKFDCLPFYELRLQRVWKNCQLSRLSNLFSTNFSQTSLNNQAPFPPSKKSNLIFSSSIILGSCPSSLPLLQALSHVCSIFRNFLVLAINPIMIAPIRRPADYQIIALLGTRQPPYCC